MSSASDLLRSILERQRTVILDGGLAAELEARGADLAGPLWSARLLADDPEAIVRLHTDYLVAGTDCITTATYQATLEGFARLGLARARAEGLLVRAVELALAARDAFWSDDPPEGRLRPLVAASVGPYGAFLADGSEYRGDYGKTERELVAFHRPRLGVLAATGADLLACETIPSRIEAAALARLVDETPAVAAWISFSCRDERTLWDGSALAEVVAEIEPVAGIVAVGVNCVTPRLVPRLIATLRAATAKPIAVYPNSGERYDAAARRWVDADAPIDFGVEVTRWRDAGAALIGGCCRTGPTTIQRIRAALLGGDTRGDIHLE